MSSPGYTVLKTGQNLFTQITGIKTSSIEALEEMFKDQEVNIKNQTSTDPVIK